MRKANKVIVASRGKEALPASAVSPERLDGKHGDRGEPGEGALPASAVSRVRLARRDG